MGQGLLVKKKTREVKIQYMGKGIRLISEAT